MSRHADLVVWVVSGWLLGAICPPPARGQVQALPPSTAPAQQPAPYGGARYEMDATVNPQRFVDMNVQVGDHASSGPSSCEPLSYGSLGYEPFPRGPASCGDCYTWQLLPDGLIYKSYLAGAGESRFASHWIYEQDHGWLWDATLGGRVGILRYGTSDATYPEGWQADIEGAAFPRLDLEEDHDRDLISANFRFGIPLTARRGPWEGKFAYYHLSSHLGDEFLQSFPSASRINYVRDCLVLGIALRPHPDFRIYSEAGWAFSTDGGAKPWEFQFGVDFSPAEPSGIFGAPFFAINGRIREEVEFGGSLTVQTGWQWRGRTGHLMRVGAHYFNGKSDQCQFFTDHEEQIGIGVWYDH